MIEWDVRFAKKVVKQKNKLNEDLQTVLLFLIEDLKKKGGNPGKNWPNYSKFKGLKGQKKSDDLRHCHLQKGNPTYVCCWKLFDDIKMIEVYYVGTHENAPY